MDDFASAWISGAFFLPLDEPYTCAKPNGQQQIVGCGYCPSKRGAWNRITSPERD